MFKYASEFKLYCSSLVGHFVKKQSTKVAAHPFEETHSLTLAICSSGALCGSLAIKHYLTKFEHSSDSLQVFY